MDLSIVTVFVGSRAPCVLRSASSVNNFTEISSQKLLIEFGLNFTEMISGWSPTKVVYLFSCLRSRTNDRFLKCKLSCF